MYRQNAQKKDSQQRQRPAPGRSKSVEGPAPLSALDFGIPQTEPQRTPAALGAPGRFCIKCIWERP